MKLRTALLCALASLLTGVLVSQAQVPGVNSTLNSVFTLAYDNSTMKPTYSASNAGVTTTSNGGDVCSLYGSATKTVKVRRVLFGGVTAALQTDPVSIIKRSTLNNGGTVGAPMVVTAYDTSNTASTAITDIYTVAPTTQGTFIGVLVDKFITLNGATTAVAAIPVTEFTFGALGQPVVLRGVLQSVSVNTAGLAGFNMSCTFEWTEE